MSTELEAVRSLFEEKQTELSKAVGKVDELTRQLNDLKNNKLGSAGQDGVQQVNGGSVDNQSSTNELEKLRKELSILNRMNEEQHRRLNDQRNLLRKRNEDGTDLDRRIEELTDRLKKKRQPGTASDEQWSANPDRYKNSAPPAKMHTIVAAVEPLKQVTGPSSQPQNEYDMIQIKQRQNFYPGDQMNNNNSQGIAQRIDQQPYSRGQPEGVNVNRPVPPYLPRQNTYDSPSAGHSRPHQEQGLMKANSSDNLLSNNGAVVTTAENTFATNRAMFDKQAANAQRQMPQGNRSNSAMAQLFNDKPGPQGKPESLTAKVRPMFAKGQSHDHGSPNSSAPSSQGINLFTYSQPPPVGSYLPSNVTVLPSGNIRYTQPPAGHPPPPYPTGSRASYGDGNSPDRNVSIDIEALRRKFAHAPRPLKKRSSVTEPERPQGPAIPKFIYEQIYKQANTPFYRPGGEAVQPPPHPHHDTPPPAYVPPPTLPMNQELMNELEPRSFDDQSPALRKQEQNLRKITAAIQMNTKSIAEEVERKGDQDDDGKYSNDMETGSDLSSSTAPSIVLPQFPYDKVPTKSNLKNSESAVKGLHIRYVYLRHCHWIFPQIKDTHYCT